MLRIPRAFTLRRSSATRSLSSGQTPTFFQQNEPSLNSQSVYTLPLQTAPLASVTGSTYSTLSFSNDSSAPHPYYHLQPCEHTNFMIQAQGKVENQASPLGPLDLMASDHAMQDSLTTYADSLKSHGISDHSLSLPYIHKYGKILGHPNVYQSALAAEQNPPTLVLYDGQGRRLDAIAYSSSYHKLMSLGQASGAVAYGYRPKDEKFLDKVVKDVVETDRSKFYEDFYKKGSEYKGKKIIF